MTITFHKAIHRSVFSPDVTGCGRRILFSLGVFYLVLLRFCPSCSSANVIPVPPPANTANTLENIPNNVNVHFQTQYCSLCHETKINEILPNKLRFGNNLKAGCRCHYNNPGDLRHPTDVPLLKSMQAKTQELFPLSDGNITCISCHSFKILCAKEKPAVSSLRGAPYKDRTAFCFRCHEEQEYAQLNPHKQLDESGKIISEKCLFCHIKKPDETHANFNSIKLIGGLEMLCQGCHNVSDKHPAGKPHMVKPPLIYQVRMRKIESDYGIILPLDENGKLTCITCHNPHDAGVIPSTLPGAKGAGEKLRHRLPKTLCAECHWHPLSNPTRK